MWDFHCLEGFKSMNKNILVFMQSILPIKDEGSVWSLEQFVERKRDVLTSFDAKPVSFLGGLA